MTAVAVFVLLAVATAFCFALGVGLLAVIPLVLAVIVGGWAVMALLRGATPGGAVRHTTKPDLLGPGGPDDPDRGR